MRPDVVTFWHGPLDALRRTCLRSPVRPGGSATAGPGPTLPHSFPERLRPPQPDGSWRDWTILQFSDFFRMRLMAQQAGLWVEARRLPLQAAARVRRLGVVPAAGRSDRSGVRKSDGAGGTDAGLAGAAASPYLRVAAAPR